MMLSPEPRAVPWASLGRTFGPFEGSLSGGRGGSFFTLDVLWREFADQPSLRDWSPWADLPGAEAAGLLSVVPSEGVTKLKWLTLDFIGRSCCRQFSVAMLSFLKFKDALFRP